MPVFAPLHRVWLLRAAAAIGGLGIMATGFALHGETYSVNSPAFDPSALPTHSVASTPTPTEIAARARQASVKIEAFDRTGAAFAEGTGFFISPNGLLATNHHVITGARALKVTSLDGTAWSDVYLVTLDEARDLAVLRVDRHGSFLPIAGQPAPAPGDAVYVIGNPLGQMGTFSTGVVSATRTIEGRDLIQITAPISPGSSGGPVLNAAGDVIGVATLNLRGGQNINLAVSSEYLPAMERDTGEVLFTTFARIAAAVRARQAAETRQRSGDTPPALPREVAIQLTQSDSLMRSVGYAALGPIGSNSLPAGGAIVHPVDLPVAGAYIMRAFCDNDCGRMRLALRDGAGNLVTEDATVSDSPYILFTAGPGRYFARVTMVVCAQAPCVYGIRLYQTTTAP